MPRLYLVRHAEPRRDPHDPDPGLTARGQEQADAVAARLAAHGSMPLVTSPMRRAMRTALPISRRLVVEMHTKPEVGEVPTPRGRTDRSAWIREFARGRWSEQAPDVLAWRDRVLHFLLGIRRDAVVVTHLVAINVAVGAAMDDDRVVVHLPDFASVTVLESDGRHLRVVDPGDQADTTVT